MFNRPFHYRQTKVYRPKLYFMVVAFASFRYKPFYVECLSTQRNKYLQVFLSSVQQTDILDQKSKMRKTVSSCKLLLNKRYHRNFANFIVQQVNHKNYRPT